MRPASIDAWVFATKTYIASILALYIALAADLDRPGWAVATVFIASQPLSGATISKSTYRFLGTVIGAVATVILVPNLVDSPEMLSLALAAWVSVCLFCSLQDRTPRSYVFMLAGYSAALIGFPGVDAPQEIFNTAVARVEEITLGIVCSSLVHGLVFPSTVGRAVLRRVDNWLQDARHWSAALLRLERPVTSAPRNESLHRKAAAYTAELDALWTHLAYDTSGLRGERKALRALHERLERLLPVLASIDSRLQILREQGIAMPGVIEQLFVSLADCLANDREELAMRRLLAQMTAVLLSRSDGDSWEHVLWLGVVMRMRELLNNVLSCDRLRENLAASGTIDRPIAFHRKLPVRRHIDQLMALLSSGTAFIAILVSCALWILAGWSGGASIPMIAAVCCSFFATQDSPLPSMFKFGTYAVVAVLITVFYSVFVLPAATSFEMVALLIAPAFLWLGFLMASPATNFIGMVISTNMATLLGLDNHYVSNPAGTLNGGIALMIGVIVTTVIMGTMRARTPQWAAARIVRAARADMVKAIETSRYSRRRRLERDAFIRRMLDRVHLVLPRVGETGPQRLGGNLIPDLRLGVNMLDLQNMLSAMPTATGIQATQLMDGLLSFIRTLLRVPDAEPPASLRLQIDEVFTRTSAGSWDGKYKVLLALSGIRLVLFPGDVMPSAN